MTRARDFANVISGNFDLPAGALDNAGGGGTSFITKTTSSSVASVSFDNLSTDFDSYVFDLDMHPVSDNVYLGVYLLNSSGSVISGSGNYGYQYFDEGTHTNQSSSGIIKINDEEITYSGISALNLTGCVRGVNGTTAATHTAGDNVLQFPAGVNDILESNYRNDQNVDAPMTKISRSQYQAFSNKTDKGTPNQYFVQRFIDKVTITLYLTPGSQQAQTGYCINFYYTQRIQDVGAYTNATDVPFRFIPCMTSGLAYYLAIKYAPQRVQELKLLYEDEFARALAEDGSPVSTFISPKVYYPELG